MEQKQKRMLSSLLIYVLIGFIILLILTNFYLGINKAITHNPVPKVCGFSPLIVLSGSMQPALYPGDVVVIREKKAQEYKIGDIVTYLDGQTVFTHRIIAQEAGQFVLKGDNNNTVDDMIGAEQLEGKVVLTIPKIGIFMVFLKRPSGMALMALLILLWIFGGDIYRKVKKSDSNEEQMRS